MNHKLSIIVCETYLKEVGYVIETNGYHDIDIISHPSECMNCMTDDAAVCHHLGKIEQTGHKNSVNLLGCMPKSSKAKTNGQSYSKPRLCYSVLAGETFVNSYSQQGVYLLTPGWLVNWKKHVIDAWGFDESSAKLFFNEVASKIVLLDSGIYDSIDATLKEFSTFVGLEATVISVGVDYITNQISAIYWKWKNEQKEIIIQKKTRQLAQYSLVYDMILEINKLVETEEIIQKMFELFVMLTGASKVAYLSTKNGNRQDIRTYRNKAYDGGLLHTELNFYDYRINDKETGFLLKADIGDGIIDYLEIDEVAVAEHIQEYIRLSIHVFKICAFMISNRNELYKLIMSIMQLEEDNKAKSTFFANISHELRTPINVLFSGIQLVEKLIESNSYEKLTRAGYHLCSMKQNCFRLLRLVNNVIDITKIESKFMNMNIKHVNIIHIIEGITSSVAEYAKQKQISVEFVSAYSEIIMAVDVDKIDRIFFNLLSNAVKFTPAGGSIIVKVENDLDCVAISVKDNGTGIPGPMLSQIFNRFTQVENSLVKTHEGSGIGLSMVKSLVEMHNGKVSVQSEEGKGSEFTVELPLEISCQTISVREDHQQRYQNLVEMLSVEFSDIYIDR